MGGRLRAAAEWWGKPEMKNLIVGAAALMATAFVASSASANTVLVTSANSQGWGVVASETSGGGSATITTDAARSGVASLEMHGDKARYALGSIFSSASNLGLFSNFTDLAFEYKIDEASVSACCGPMYAPALRIVVWDQGVKRDFVWEQAYQAGGYGAAAAIGEWNTIAAGGTFFRNPVDGDQRTLASWASSLTSNAYVGGVYLAVGSGIGANYTAYVDNVTAGGTTYNFEAVPEPATWAMMIMGLGAAGSVIRRRRVALAKA
jgi:hypothetical protein